MSGFESQDVYSAVLSTLSQRKIKRGVIKKRKFGSEISDSLVKSLGLEGPSYAVGILRCLWLLIIYIE